jgi:hypothetical protein
MKTLSLMLGLSLSNNLQGLLDTLILMEHTNCEPVVVADYT